MSVHVFTLNFDNYYYTLIIIILIKKCVENFLHVLKLNISGMIQGTDYRYYNFIHVDKVNICLLTTIGLL